MKKLLLIFFTVFLLSGCFIFKKKEKYGCPATAANTGAENVDISKKQKKKDRFKVKDIYKN